MHWPFWEWRETKKNVLAQDGFPSSCKPLNNCRSSKNAAEAAVLCGREYLLASGAVCHSDFEGEVVMDAAVVMESGAPLTLALASPVTSYLCRGRWAFVWTVCDRQTLVQIDSACQQCSATHTHTHTHRVERLPTAICSPPQIQQ